MTLLTMHELNAPYPYVVSDQAVADVRRLLRVVPNHSMLDLASSEARAAHRSILELEGLGREIWEGVDPLQYIEGLRGEWDSR